MKTKNVFLALLLIFCLGLVFYCKFLIKKNLQQREKVEIAIELIRGTGIWYIFDETRVSSEKNSGYLIELPEKLKPVFYSDAPSGYQKPVKGLVVVFETSFDQLPDETGNGMLDGLLFYYYK